MTETKHPEKLTVTPAKATLTLKRSGVEQGMVKQSFSHGRTKAVVVEKVKSRRPDARAEAAPSTAPAPSGAGTARKPPLTTARGRAPPRAPAPSGAGTARRPPLTTARGGAAPASAPPATPKRGGGLVLERLT